MTLAPPFITAFTAGLLIVIQMVLLASVVLIRRRVGQSLGDGGRQDLVVAIRRHGNFAENAAIFIVCSGLLEILSGGGPRFMIMCASFVVGRICHLIGLSMKRTVNLFRVAGIVLTIGPGVTVGIRLIMIAWRHLAG